jgi:hypothetical protein
MRNTSVPWLLASLGHSNAGSGLSGSSCPVTNVTVEASVRWVTGIHDFKRHSGGGQRLRLFPPSTEHEGIAALQTHHRFAGVRPVDQQAIDLALRRIFALAPAPDIEAFGALRSMPKQQRVGEKVVQDHLRLLKAFPAAQRQELRVAGTRSDQVDDSDGSPLSHVP